MKYLFVLLTVFIISQSSICQENVEFKRKGKVLIEVGYNAIGGFNTGTGIGMLVVDGETLSSVGGNVGIFLSERFALKLAIGLLAVENSNISNFSAGCKYYIINKIPVELGVGILNAGKGISPYGKLNFGYAGKLADNILLELSPGIMLFPNNNNGILELKLGFSLLL